jgi:hypothetical protein
MILLFYSDIFVEEMLIDFKEILGEHSGVNEANQIWETLTSLGLPHKVR